MTRTFPNPFNVSLEFILERISYDPLSGEFRWLPRTRDMFPDNRSWRRFNNRFPGKLAGSIYGNGYRYITINYVDYRANRLAWFIQTGDAPVGLVDHIDGDKTNDRWANFRLADKSQNGCNRPKQKNNVSGFKGVFWNTQTGSWKAVISLRGKATCVGLFDNAEAAGAAYQSAALRIHGEFSYQGDAA